MWHDGNFFLLDTVVAPHHHYLLSWASSNLFLFARIKFGFLGRSCSSRFRFAGVLAPALTKTCNTGADADRVIYFGIPTHKS